MILGVRDDTFLQLHGSCKGSMEDFSVFALSGGAQAGNGSNKRFSANLAPEIHQAIELDGRSYEESPLSERYTTTVGLTNLRRRDLNKGPANDP